jgi:hypothetical protein
LVRVFSVSIAVSTPGGGGFSNRSPLPPSDRHEAGAGGFIQLEQPAQAGKEFLWA